MQAKKIKKTMIKETLQSMEPGQFVMFSQREVEEAAVRSAASDLNREGFGRFTVNKEKGSKRCKVSRL
jgi:NAD(P)H-flavin reductase